MKSALRLTTQLILSVGIMFIQTGGVVGQSIPTKEMFHGEDVVHGITIARSRCEQLEAEDTAAWVVVDGEGSCLRYYAFGLAPETKGNPIAAGWLHGDIVGSNHPTNADKHQKGLGVAAMIEQERQLSDRYHVPFVFLARPGAYGSAGYHPTEASTKREADLVDAEIDAIKRRYRIKAWALGGHSGGGTLVSEMLARRNDIRCAVISSGAAAHNAYLEAHDAASETTPQSLNPIDDVDHISPSALSVIVMGDPRDENVFYGVQQIYYEALVAHGVEATLLPLQRGLPPEFHSLVSLAEAATGLCARGSSIGAITAALNAMPSQTARVSN